MIGKPQWFERRKFGGWGLHPKTWQGWVYIAVFLIPFAIFQALPFWTNEVRFTITGVWLGLLLIDVFDIMLHLKRDEREMKHEAFAERNVAWVMVIIITLGILYQSVISALNQTFKVDVFLIVALFAGVITKAVSNLYFDKKN